MAVFAFFIFIPSAAGDYVRLDDYEYVLMNDNLYMPFSEFIKYAFTSFDLTAWHPLTWISYKMDFMLWAKLSIGYSMESLLIHSFNSALIFLVALRFLLVSGVRDRDTRLAAAFVVGLGFAVHPLHAEPVAWIASRKDVLFSFFWILSVSGIFQIRT